MKIVIDTNVIISAFLFKNSVPDQALRLASLHSTILLSEAISTELKRVLSRQKFNRYSPLENRLRTLQDFIESAIMIDVVTTIGLCRDPKDNKFLELAVDGEADYLITGDQDLLVLHPFQKTQIITPADFLRQ